MPANPKIDRLVETLIGAYERAGKQIEDELQSILGQENQFRRRARLRELAEEVERLKAELDEQAANWMDSDLRSIYRSGAELSSAAAGVDFSWTQTHEAAVKAIAQETMRNMLKATTHMTKDAKRLIRASSKEATLMKLLTGQTARQAAKGLERELRRNSIAAVIYKDGSRHGIAEYAELNLRTTTAIAYNRGTLNEAKVQGAKYVILYDGPGCCVGPGHRTGPEANNLILPIGEASRNLISHVRCRRSMGPLMEVRSKKQAEAAMEAGTYATTASQDAAQRAADALTRGQQRLAARKRAREKRLAKQAEKRKSA